MNLRKNTESLTESIDKELRKEALGDEGVEQLWNRIEEANRRWVRTKRFQRWVVTSSGVAACLSVAMLLIWRLQPWDGTPPVDYAAIMSLIEVESSTDIELTLADGQRVSVSDKYAEIDHLSSELITVNGESFKCNTEMKVGATGGDEETAARFNRIATPFGKRSQVTLPDGTSMWVNSNTRVIYPAAFTGDKREIFVEGEVFLDVAHNEQLPFIVKTRTMEVRALGTRFNVSTDAPGARSEVVLVDGKVEVGTGDGNDGENEKVILHPSQLLSFDSDAGRTVVHNIDPDDYVAWKDGYFQFHRQSMDFILTKLTKFYGISMQWDDNVRHLTCSGKLDLKDEPTEVLETLKKAAPIGVRTEAGVMKIYVKD
jgi:ferric-dicitrate binding protein FerR (iron transport regulator)